MITTLSGENSFGLQQKLRELTSDFVSKHGDMSIERLDGQEATQEQIIDRLQGISMFANRKMVVLKTPGQQKFFSENFAKIMEQVPDGTELVIVEPKLDKRTAYYKALIKNTKFVQFDELDESSLAKWLSTEASSQQGRLVYNDAKYLVERVGANQQLLYQELQKLLDYDPAITRQTIDLLSEPSPQSTVFELLDAAFAGKAKRALELYHEQRQQKVEPLMILGMLAWQLHVLAVIQAAGERSVEQIAADAKINPFVVRKSMGIARNLSRARLQELTHNLLQLDIELKSQAINADDALSQYILELSD